MKYVKQNFLKKKTNHLSDKNCIAYSIVYKSYKKFSHTNVIIFQRLKESYHFLSFYLELYKIIHMQVKYSINNILPIKLFSICVETRAWCPLGLISHHGCLLSLSLTHFFKLLTLYNLILYSTV